MKFEPGDLVINETDELALVVSTDIVEGFEHKDDHFIKVRWLIDGSESREWSNIFEKAKLDENNFEM